MKKQFISYIVFFALYCSSFGQSEIMTENLLIKTELGDIHVQLDLRNAPITSANF